MTMKTMLLALLCVLALDAAVAAQPDKLGKVNFPTSCDPKVQAQFERGVAMLHSYWFIQARKTFESVLQQDPNCAMAIGASRWISSATRCPAHPRRRSHRRRGRRWRRLVRSARKPSASATGSRR